LSIAGKNDCLGLLLIGKLEYEPLSSNRSGERNFAACKSPESSSSTREKRRIEFEEAFRLYREILTPASSDCTLQARDIQLQTGPLYHMRYKSDIGDVRIGAMESLVVSPTAEPRGSSDIGDEFFFLKLFLRSTIDSASRAGAAPIETELFGVETQVERLGFYSGPSVPRVL